MNEYNESSTSCPGGRSDNLTGRTNGNQRGGLRSDPTILGGVDINLEENNSIPPPLSEVWDSSLLAMWLHQYPRLASPQQGTLVADRQCSLDLTLAIVEEALAILECVEDQPTPPLQ